MVFLSRLTRAATRNENGVLGFQTMSDTNWPVQSQKKAGILNFLILDEELCYTQNTGGDHVCSYRMCKIRFSHDAAQNISASIRIQ